MTDKEIEELNAEMADEILREIGETVDGLPCCHGPSRTGSTPPMFYRERMLCVVATLRKKIVELGGDDPFKGLESQGNGGGATVGESSATLSPPIDSPAANQ